MSEKSLPEEGPVILCPVFDIDGACDIDLYAVDGGIAMTVYSAMAVIKEPALQKVFAEDPISIGEETDNGRCIVDVVASSDTLTTVAVESAISHVNYTLGVDFRLDKTMA